MPILTGEPTPPRHRLLSPSEKTLLLSQTTSWLQEGVIEKCAQRLPWVNNTVFVAKKNGDIRVCIDCTPTNAVTIEFDWPLPRLQDIRLRTSGALRFSRLDLKSAFFRISVPNKYRRYTAFESGGSHWQFRKMPFGLSTAPATFQRFMDHLLAPFSDWCICYIDDILLSAKTSSQLTRRTHKVRARLRRLGCEVNENKSEEDKEGLLFAGMWIFSSGQGPNKVKVNEILSTPVPTTKVEKASALGLVSYLRDHIPLAAHLTADLYPSKENDLLSLIEYEKRWNQLMRHIARSVTTLSCWDEEAEAALYCDASGVAISGMILQKGRIVALASRKMSPAEQRYSATDREHLALVFSAKKFRVFLHRTGATTTVYSDHSALLGRKLSEMTPRQTRWAMIVAQWVPNLVHVKGKENPADYPSRWAVEVVGGQISSTT